MKFILLTLIIPFMVQPKPTLVYIGDPMCSWCYGISDELDSALKLLEDRVDQELIVGGLRPGGGDEWNEGFTQFLKHHWEEVSIASGLPFTYDILSTEHFEYDTEPACRSIVIVKEMAPAKAFEFFRLVQQGFYVDNKDPKEATFYKPICEKLMIDYTTFANRFEDVKYRNATAIEFSKARALGVNSFPTLLLKVGEEYHEIGRGFMKSADIVSKVELLLTSKGY